MLPTRDSLQIKDTQTESKGIEKGIPCKWKQKESWAGITYTKQTLKQGLTKKGKGIKDDREINDT